jgi:hypothetical protein
VVVVVTKVASGAAKLAGSSAFQGIGCWVNKQFKMFLKIYSHNRKWHSSQ